jgi:hypothetical protein
MKNFLKLPSLKLLLVALVLVLPLSGVLFPVRAAVLTDVTVTPGVLTVSSATNVTLTFTPVTAITNSTILEYSYSTAFTGGAALVNADIAITGTNISSKTCTGFVAGYFRCTLTTSGSVTTTVTTVIGGTNQLSNPSTAGNYSFSVTADIGGAGTTYDTGAGLAYIASENQVQVKAVVPPVLALDLYDSGTTTLMTNPNTCNLGVLSINAVNTCAYNVGVGTNSSTGARVRVNAGGQFTNGSVNMTNASGAITAGTEAYGFYISTAGSRFTASGSYGSAYQTVPTSATDFATSTQTSDKATLAHHFTVTHGATMGTSTATGNYTQTVFYTAFTR